VGSDAPLEQGLTLTGLFARSVVTYPANEAFACAGKKINYRELDVCSTAIARFLLASGLVAGDHVALMMPNSLYYPVAAIGVLKAGMAIVSVNPLYTARELTHQLKDSEAKAIFATEGLLPLLSTIAETAPIPLVISVDLEKAILGAPGPVGKIDGNHSSVHHTFSDALSRGLDSRIELPKVKPESISFLQYTGGTTGPSKGAALSHAVVLANVIQQSTWLQTAFKTGNTSGITALPLYHIFALNVMFLLLRVGGSNRLLSNARDLKTLIAEMEDRPFHVFPGVNALFNALLATGQLNKQTFRETRVVMGAGASVMGAVAGRWEDATGVPITEGYGLTECGPGVTFNAIVPHWTGGIGYPFPSTDLRIIDAEGKVVPVGTPGELCVKGPQVFSGYWKRPEETAKVFTSDGWFRTGDIARMDEDGMFYIVDRLKDMIIVSAFNVFPNEIEGVVASMEAVLECACVGVPDERSGEAPHLFVVRKDPALLAEDVLAHCRINLTGYKVPRYITFVEQLPKSPVGKILRRELRAELLAVSAS
jgi:long-chain acyl-CoA synthetase